MRVLITGSNGFVGKNLVVALRERPGYEVATFAREHAPESLPGRVAGVDAVVHLAGINRPADPAEFESGNAELTRTLCRAIEQAGRPVALIVASTTQVERDNPYGRSKRAAEEAAEDLARRTGNPVAIYRLPGVFGKWCRPDYNSVVATYCHNLARDLPIRIDDPAALLRLVHIDDVVAEFMTALSETSPGVRWGSVSPEYQTTLGELARQIEAFRNCRDDLLVERVGTGFTRALYATYVSYLPAAKFSYGLPIHTDARGVFVEMLKTLDSGQFSYFTAHPGVTRGGHYHHAKTEKFLVLKGKARFRFRHILSDDRHEVSVCGERPTIVETIPGWAHEITNTGSDELVVMLWANEIFDRNRPDTVASPV
jgi:UDP-2-acetamido-2,6-beta-L-arabino-hexul-4-ose reductase